MSTTATGSVPIAGLARRIGRAVTRRPVLGLAATVTAPVAWLLVVYIGSLLLLIVTAFFSIDGFTQRTTTELTAGNLDTAFTEWVFVRTVLRSVGVATAVTMLCIAIALPMAFYIAKVATTRVRRSLIVAVLLPLWAGYLVKAYAWRAMLQGGDQGGVLKSWLGFTPGFGIAGVIVTLTYLWLPYMVLPVYAGLERLPASLLDAAGDLGARPWRSFRTVVVPLLVPSIAAGSLFTFSLSLGDYITPKVVGGTTQLIGNLIERTLLAPNQPLAAAYTLWPVVIVVAYLVAMTRLGAFESLK